MAVVINEFEVLTQPAPSRAQATPGAGAQNKPADKPEPKDLAPLLRALQAEALRVWAH